MLYGPVSMAPLARRTPWPDRSFSWPEHRSCHDRRRSWPTLKDAKTTAQPLGSATARPRYPDRKGWGEGKAICRPRRWDNRLRLQTLIGSRPPASPHSARRRYISRLSGVWFCSEASTRASAAKASGAKWAAIAQACRWTSERQKHLGVSLEHQGGLVGPAGRL